MVARRPIRFLASDIWDTDEENGVQPDIIFISRDRLGIISDRDVEGAPDPVVEVLSPRTQSRDRGIKMRRYAAAGVSHYWILVPRTRSIEPYGLGENGYERLGVYGPETVFQTELFPGLELPVDVLWQ